MGKSKSCFLSAIFSHAIKFSVIVVDLSSNSVTNSGVLILNILFKLGGILLCLYIMYRIRPSKSVLDLSRLDALQGRQKGRAYWTRFLGGIINIRNCLRGGGAGYRTNWQQCSGSSGS